jgi:peptidoglycan/xylan/chitin deacetylase (PgdA/CDA1 family)
MGITRIRHQRLAPLLALCVAAASLAGACAAAPAKAHHLSFGCGGTRRIALTFDDGPNPPYTGQILDLLTAAGARATFFDEGEAVEAHPDIVRDEIARGMTVGSHSYSHSPDLPVMSHAAFADDLRRAEDALVAALGAKPDIYRSPYGHTSGVMLEEERKRGYTSIGWDIDSEDWADASADRVVTNVLGHAHPGAIVLMHDGGLGGGNPDRSTTIAALPRIVEGLRQQGYTLVTVPEVAGLSATGNHAEATCSAN